MWDIIVKGGPIMVPLVLCSVISLAVIIERFIYFKRTSNNNYRLFQKYSRYIIDDNLTKAIKELKDERGPIAGIIASALTYSSGSKNNLREFLQTTGEQEIEKMEKNLVILDVIATIAPLLGLLGTVLGIIDSFDILSATGGVASPVQLSSGIARALLTTAAGLFIAIPALIFYTHFVRIVNTRIREITRWTRELYTLLEGGEDGI